MNSIICVNETNPIPRSIFYPKITSRCLATIGLVKYFHAIISLSILITNRAAIVRTAIIYQKQFEIRECLLNNAINAAMQIVFRVVY